jgi:hypothetical protein
MNLPKVKKCDEVSSLFHSVMRLIETTVKVAVD